MKATLREQITEKVHAYLERKITLRQLNDWALDRIHETRTDTEDGSSWGLAELKEYLAKEYAKEVPFSSLNKEDEEDLFEPETDHEGIFTTDADGFHIGEPNDILQ